MSILTSIRGRMLGLDNRGNVVTPNSFRTDNVGAASTGTTIANSGITTLASTAGNNLTFQLAAPVSGIRKTIVATGASTGTVVSSTGVGATIVSTATGTSTKATFVAPGQGLVLVGLSATQWGVESNIGAVAFSS